MVSSVSLLQTLREKEKLLVTSNFSIFHIVFYPFQRLSAIFIKLKIVVCKLFQSFSWKSLKFVVWQRVNSYFTMLDHVPRDNRTHLLPHSTPWAVCNTNILGYLQEMQQTCIFGSLPSWLHKPQ